MVTGLYIGQDGTLSTPYKMNYSVIKELSKKEIKEMSIKQLRKFIAKIAYIRQLHPKRFKTTQVKAIKQLKKLQKIQNN